MIREKRAFSVSGYGMLVVLLLLQVFAAAMLVRSLAATVEGRFEPGSIPAKQLEAALKNRVKAAARRYAPHFKID